MTIRSLSAVTLATHDMARAVRFYRALELEPAARPAAALAAAAQQKARWHALDVRARVDRLLQDAAQHSVELGELPLAQPLDPPGRMQPRLEQDLVRIDVAYAGEE